VSSLIDFILHIDQHLLEFVSAYGPWVYGILFAIVFTETGLVIWPFLPGDSLLFATGAIAATGALNAPTAAVVLIVAAFAGDSVNYSLGRALGPRVFNSTDQSGLVHRLLNREHLAQAHAFFERYGGKAVVLGRFVPIVRTFVPFVAGAGAMAYPTFVLYNFVGAVGWVGLCMGAGLLFGNIPMVRENFSLITLGIVAVSVLPMVIEFVRHRRRAG
jgi:membrane-associated protein